MINPLFKTERFNSKIEYDKIFGGKMLKSKFLFKTLSIFCVVSFASEKAHWSYEGEHGPTHWGKFDGATLCEEGKEQSPVDLKWKKPASKRKVNFQYQSKLNFKTLDNGHTIQANFPSGNFVQIDGQKFELVQLHFHAHSEHSLSKKYFPLEMHLVHKNADGKLAVVGVLFEEGKENPELNKIWASIPEKKNEEKEANEQIVLLELIPKVHTHYHYMGSLTTPPCSEGVNWNVLNTPISISSSQLAMFTKRYANNYRPIQTPNFRKPANY